MRTKDGMPERASDNVVQLFRQACINLFPDRWNENGKPRAKAVRAEAARLNKSDSENLMQIRWYQIQIKNNLIPSSDAKKQKRILVEISNRPSSQPWSFSTGVKTPIDILTNVYQYATCIDEPFNIFMAEKIHELDHLLVGGIPEVIYEIALEYYWRAVFEEKDNSDLDIYVQTLNANNGLRPVMLGEYYKAKEKRLESKGQVHGNAPGHVPSAQAWEPNKQFNPLLIVSRKVMFDIAGDKWLAEALKMLDENNATREHRLRLCNLLVQISKGSKWGKVKPNDRYKKLFLMLEWFEKFIVSNHIPASEYAEVPEQITTFFGINEKIGG